jgi:hypothetical protein
MNDQSTRSGASIHTIIVLEDHLVSQLISGQGHVLRALESFDRASALDRELAVRFLRKTEPDKREELEGHDSDLAEAELFKNVEKALKTVRRSTCCERASR